MHFERLRRGGLLLGRCPSLSLDRDRGRFPLEQHAHVPQVGESDRCQDRQDAHPRDDQPLRAGVAEPIEQHPAQPVAVQNVTRPEQDIGVHQAEQDEPQVASVVDTGQTGRDPLRQRAIRHQHDAGAEQHREDRAHLAVEQDGVEEPDADVETGVPPRHLRRGVGGERQPHRHDVHHQDAEHGDAAQDVERVDPLGRAHGGGKDPGAGCRGPSGVGRGRLHLLLPRSPSGS